MPRKVYEPRFRRFGCEFFVDRVGLRFVFLFCQKRHVHDRTAVFVGGCTIDGARIEVVVQAPGLCIIARFHAFRSAVFFYPMKHFTDDVDRIARRRIVQRIFVGVRFIREHRRRTFLRRIGDEVVPDDDERNARRPEIFLRACKDEAESAHVQRLGQDARRDIGDERNTARIGNVIPVRALDRVVEADIRVIVIARDFIDFRDIAKIAVFRRRGDIDGNVFFRFFDRFTRPHAGIDIDRFARTYAEIQRHHRKLSRTAALQKHDFVVVGHAHEFPHHSFRVLNDRLKCRRTMAHLHNRLTRAFVVEHFIGTLFQHFFRQTRRSRRKIVHTSHK